ncbi:Bestrophin, RFP-TM, chloride channel-domain-containing protein [Catenaria anguillulae PL171]|uniref:Bestrophin, RFP-TM, chloride channel-domain-containing protein n=1 Tax=Catenaria anguillulae PL171 TaxID=765915 RepID=A0A1Y2HNS2_9FUNG|nr:Bestrophin, RFP-TM, chloride channel-domain-containing protein [Catenaria anguillulae PL171]
MSPFLAYYGYPDMLRVRGSVVVPVMFPVLVVTIWAVLVSILNAATDNWFSIKNTLFVTLTGFVLSLLLAFKNNTSYEKHNEGRKLFATLLTASRNASRLIWVGVAEKTEADVIEKRQAIRLILAFFIAVKNHLRGQDGLQDEHGRMRVELVELIPENKRAVIMAQAQRRRQSTSAPTSPVVATVAEAAGTAAATNAATLHNRAGAGHKHHAKGYLSLNDANVPADISHFLAAWIHSMFKAEKIDSSQFGSINLAINVMVETLTSLERVATSRIPTAYVVHYKQLIWLYLLLLPFQLVPAFGPQGGLIWSPIMTFLVAFVFLGVDAIGNEIEQPFGTDAGDLPLDVYVKDLRNELEELLASNVDDLAFWSRPADPAVSIPETVVEIDEAAAEQVPVPPLPANLGK